MDELQFCSPCWNNLEWINDPLCPTCGSPKPYSDGLTICRNCEHAAFSFDSCRAVMMYNDHSKAFILRLKHSDQTAYAKIMAHFMHKRYTSLFGNIDLIIPIPLHTKRLLYRQYNQSGLIANHLGEMTNITVDHHSLKRIRATPPQGAIEISRHDNVKDAFSCDDTVRSKNIMLIDDVFTTGATVDEAAKTLKSSGCTSVRVLTFARVPLHKNF